MPQPPEPVISQRRYYLRMDQTMDRYAEFLGTASIDHLVAQALQFIFKRHPVQVLTGAEPGTKPEASSIEGQLEEHEQQWRRAMIQRALASRGVAYVLACATGITLYFGWPFPEDDLMRHLISIRAPLIFAGFNLPLNNAIPGRRSESAQSRKIS